MDKLQAKNPSYLLIIFWAKNPNSRSTRSSLNPARIFWSAILCVYNPFTTLCTFLRAVQNWYLTFWMTRRQSEVTTQLLWQIRGRCTCRETTLTPAPWPVCGCCVCARAPASESPRQCFVVCTHLQHDTTLLLLLLRSGLLGVKLRQLLMKGSWIIQPTQNLRANK